MAIKYEIGDTRWNTFYEVLQVETNAAFPEIKKAYYQRAKECHPDRNAGDEAKEQEFKVVVAAFDVLSDPQKRGGYDSYLAMQLAEQAQGRDVDAGFTYEAVESILDTQADDYLEELVVGNEIPEGTTLATLLSDMENTKLFIKFREGKTLYYARQNRRAYGIFRECVAESPNNILYRFYLARAAQRMRRYSEAEAQLSKCVRIGKRRHPPQHLRGLREKLYYLRENHGGLLGRVKNMMTDPPSRVTYDAEQELVEEHNRAIRRLMAPPTAQKQKLLGDGSEQHAE